MPKSQASGEAVPLIRPFLDALAADFGQRVTAVASLHKGHEANEAVLREFVRTKLASYKVPKQVVIVDQVRRAPSGKPDYDWAREIVNKALA